MNKSKLRGILNHPVGFIIFLIVLLSWLFWEQIAAYLPV